jgi:hypothetical protein
MSFLLALLAVTGWFYWMHERASARLEAQRQRVLERFRDRPVVFLGDSHVQCAVDDRGRRGFVNLATASEHYVFTLQKLRLLQPRGVVIGTWIHNFLPYYERLLGRVFLARYGIVSAQLRPEERRELVARLDFESASFIRAKRLLPFLGTRLIDHSVEKRAGLGGFYGGPGRTTFGFQELRGYEANLAEAKNRFPSSFQLRYLEAILEHCRSQAIRPVLLSTPVSDMLNAALPPSTLTGFQQLTARLHARYDVPHWDYTRLRLHEEMFRDLDHLSARGASEFTRKLATRLRHEGLLPERSPASSRSDRELE